MNPDAAPTTPIAATAPAAATPATEATTDEQWATLSVEKRQELSNKLKAKYPDCVPVIIRKGVKQEGEKLQLTKSKYAVKVDATVSKLLFKVRENLPRLGSKDGLYLFVGSTLPTMNDTMESVYAKHKNEDGFLYVDLYTENTFGRE